MIKDVFIVKHVFPFFITGVYKPMYYQKEKEVRLNSDI